MTRRKSNAAVVADVQKLVSEQYAGEIYRYLPLGDYVVAAPGVCGGRPTLKYTRMDARHIINYLKLGRSIEELARTHRVPVEAIREVIDLQGEYNYERAYA